MSIMKKHFNKLSLIFFSFILSLTSCGDFFQKVADGTKDVTDNIVRFTEPLVDNVVSGTQYVFDNVTHFTKEAVKNIQDKAEGIAGNVEEYFTGTNSSTLKNYEIKYSEKSSYQVKDGDEFANPQGFNKKELYSQRFEEFIPYYASTVLRSYGYDVFMGVAYLKGTTYSGLIFTKNNTFIEYKGKDTPTCGFVQIKLDGTDDPVLTNEIVQKGLIAVPNLEYASYKNYQKGFVVVDSATIDEQAGLYDDYYFEMEQITPYCLNVKVDESLPSDYQEYPYEIYDFDNQRVIKEKTKLTLRDQLLELQRQNSNLVDQGVATNNAISSISECLSADESICGVITVKGDDVSDKDLSLLKREVEDFNDSYSGSMDENQVREFNGQFDFDEAKVSESIISLVANSLSLVGTVATVVIGVTAGTPIIKAIVLTTGISAIIYNVSNIIESSQNLYYGLNNLEKEGVNPVYQAFKAVIKDEKTAKIVYHSWGIANTVITGLTRPISKSLEISHAMGLGTFRTAINVVRAVLVTVAKAGTAAIGGALVGNVVTKVVTYVTDSRFIGNIVGFASTLIVGMLIFKGLDNLDKKLNISGLYPKSNAVTSFNEDYSNKQKEYTWGSQNDDFKNLSRSDKEMYIRQIRDYACQDLGIENKPSLNIVYDYTDSASGYYTANDNTLTVNLASSENTTWSGLADTIGHECRHAYQYQYAYSNPNSDMAYSLSNYIPYDGTNYDAYRYQLCENDAWNYGGKFSSWLLSLLGIVA